VDLHFAVTASVCVYIGTDLRFRAPSQFGLKVVKKGNIVKANLHDCYQNFPVVGTFLASYFVACVLFCVLVACLVNLFEPMNLVLYDWCIFFPDYVNELLMLMFYQYLW